MKKINHTCSLCFLNISGQSYGVSNSDACYCHNKFEYTIGKFEEGKNTNMAMIWVHSDCLYELSPEIVYMIESMSMGVHSF